MNIAHVSSTFPPYYGGTGAVCFHNALGAARAGHTVHVFTARTSARKSWQPPQGLCVHELHAPVRIGNAPFLPGLLSLGDVDLVHLHAPFPFGGELILLQRLLRKRPYVMTYHQDLIFDGLKEKLVKIHHQLIGQHILNQAAAILVTSLDYGRASRVGPLFERAPDKIVEMPNGVDPARFNPEVDGGEVRRNAGLAAADRVVLFVGALDRPHYFKGVDVLLRALSRIPDEHIKLVIVGDGDLRPVYMQLADELGVRHRAIFQGRVSDADLPGHYAMSELVVLPSVTMGEAFGIVLLEAMACATPVIASNLPGVRSVVDDGRTGLLVEPGDDVDLADKIQTLLDNTELRHQMAEAGFHKVKTTYAWDAIIPKLLTVYEDVLDG
jgi:glycosyltransferase involved in cell wall biosynthesis